jgi:hypothetical protein
MELFTIHASKDGDRVETQDTSPTMTVAKANTLHKTGWDVHVTDSDGRRYGPTGSMKFYRSTENRRSSSSFACLHGEIIRWLTMGGSEKLRIKCQAVSRLPLVTA